MSRNPAVVSIFPFMILRTLRPGGCGGCRRSRVVRTNQDEYDRVRGTIASLPEDAKKKLKSVLNVAEVELFVRGPKGIERHTF